VFVVLIKAEHALVAVELPDRVIDQCSPVNARTVVLLQFRVGRLLVEDELE
jgi:hypothetical protein